MAQDKKITGLDPLLQADSDDVFAIVDVSGVATTKKITTEDLLASPQPIGTSNPNTGRFLSLTLPTGSTINSFTTSTSLSGNSDNSVPTERAVKTYVDSQTSSSINVRTIYSDATASSGDAVLVDTTSGDVTLTLIPSLNSKISVKKITTDANEVIVQCLGGNVDNISSIRVTGSNTSITMVSDGTNYYII